MIRYVDLAGQIYDTEYYPVHFAFFETVTDQFETFSGSVQWTSVDDFVSDWRAEESDERHLVRPLERYLTLLIPA